MPVGCPKLEYNLSTEPRLRCVYNAADGEENRVIHPTTDYPPVAEPAIWRVYTAESDQPRLYVPEYRLYIVCGETDLGVYRYSYCLNNPLIYTDPTGEFIFTALLTPIGLTALGVLIDGACWGAVIGGGVYTASTAFSPGGLSQNWNSNDFWRSVGVGAASGFVTAGMGLIAPSYNHYFTSFSGNLPTYLGKAGWAGLTAAAATGAGIMTSDFIQYGRLETSPNDYFKAMGISALTAGLMSFGSSVYDYYTWDKYTYVEQTRILQQEFGIRVEYDPNMTDYGQFDPSRSQSKLFISRKGLETRSIARSTVSHEYVHYLDFQNQVVTPVRNGLSPTMTGTQYDRFTELNAYKSEIRTANKYFIPMKELSLVTKRAWDYGAPLSSLFNFNLPMIWRGFIW